MESERMDEYVAILPLPGRLLSPNGRAHYMAKARATKRYRQNAAAVFLAASNCDRPGWSAATVQAVFYFRDRRHRDTDNLLASLKSAFDGLADAGIVANDRGLTHLPVIVVVDKANPRVVLIVRKTEGVPQEPAARTAAAGGA